MRGPLAVNFVPRTVGWDPSQINGRGIVIGSSLNPPPRSSTTSAGINRSLKPGLKEPDIALAVSDDLFVAGGRLKNSRHRMSFSLADGANVFWGMPIRSGDHLTFVIHSQNAEAKRPN